MGDFLPTILIIIFWIVIANVIGRVFKKFTGSQQQQNKPTTTQKPQQSIQDIFRELQRKLEDAQAKQNLPPYAKQDKKQETYPELKTILEEKRKISQQKEKRKPAEVLKQGRYEHREMVPEFEKQKALQYEKSVEEERRQQHDAEMRNLGKKIYSTIPDEEDSINFELDLRDALIGSIILERKFE